MLIEERALILMLVIRGIDNDKQTTDYLVPATVAEYDRRSLVA